MDYSPPGSSIHGIFQVRIPEWVAISFFRGFSWPRNWTQVSCIGRQTLLSETPGKYSVTIQLSSVQSLSHVRLFATPWTAAHQPSLSITKFRSLLKLMSIASVMPSNYLTSVAPFSFRLQSFWASGSFPMSQFFASGGQRIGVSASTSVLPMNIQDWLPLGLTGWISL